MCTHIPIKYDIQRTVAEKRTVTKEEKLRIFKLQSKGTFVQLWGIEIDETSHEQIFCCFYN